MLGRDIQASEHATVAAAARSLDYDRYLAALLAPAEVRPDLMAIAAFGGEVARIPLRVTEAMIGEIRLQWWRDALPALVRGEVTGNPVADALGAAMRRHGLPIGLLLGLTEARAFDLYADPMPDEQAFRAYLARTEGALVELGLRCLDGRPPGPAAGLAIAAGQALGLTRVLTGLPNMLARGRCPLPASRLAAAGIEIADLAAVPLPPKVRPMIAGLIADARADLGRVRMDWHRLERRLRPPFLPLAVIEPQLRAFESPAHHPARDLVSVVPLQRVWRIWAAQTWGRL